MKGTAVLLCLPIAIVSSHAVAQAPAAAKPHARSAAARTACVKVPDLSPQIPALPAGATCVKHLYTLSTVPNVKFDYISPLEGSVLHETLGIESSTFSLDYVDTKVGTGELAQPHKWYTIKYTGYLPSGFVFDASSKHPDQDFSFQYGEHQVIAGWDTGFAGMRVGGKRRLFIPYQLAYGPTAHGPIPPKSMLIFDVEFVAQSDEKPAPKTPPAPPAAAKPSAPATPPSSVEPPAGTPPANGASEPATGTPNNSAPKQ